MSPPASVRAALQSIIPAPVRSRSTFTSDALTACALIGSPPARHSRVAPPEPQGQAAQEPRAEPARPEPPPLWPLASGLLAQQQQQLAAAVRLPAPEPAP